MVKKMESFDDEDKPKRNRRSATKGRHSFHTCWHHDWWSGVIGMPPEQVGVYERIIKLMYIRRAPLRDDDKELAQLCHCDVRTYRRIKRALIERARIVHDEENGLLYDQRTIRELVDAGFFSEEQTKRAAKRKGKTPALTLVDERARSDAPNVVPLRDEAIVPIAQVCEKVDGKLGTSLMETRVYNSTPCEGKQALSVQNGVTNQYPIPNKPQIAAPNPAKPRRDPRAGSPLTGASAPPAQREDRSTWSAEKVRAWKETQLAGLAASDPEALAKAHELGQSPTGDRKARRTNG